MMENTHDTTIQDTILDQLQHSRINGFPFFAYTGITEFVMFGEGDLKLDFPKNPNGLTHVWIRYDFGDDLYNVTFHNDALPSEPTIKGIFFDSLADLIVDKLGVR